LAKGCNELLRDNPYLIKTQSKWRFDLCFAERRNLYDR
jgi:hypothetical protein